MKKKEVSELEETAACTIRGVNATRIFKDLPVENFSGDEPKRSFYGYRWFGSVKAISNIFKTGHHTVMVIKTYNFCTPKKYLESTLKDMPGGT